MPNYVLNHLIEYGEISKSLKAVFYLGFISRVGAAHPVDKSLPKRFRAYDQELEPFY